MAKQPIYVIDGDQRTPFLRGMLTHSLVERGLGFKQAYQAANQVRGQIRDRKEISKKKLRSLINAVLREEFKWEYPPQTTVHSPVILVEGEDTVPFSKGILSLSLQAAGLDPSAAYSIAREVEDRLVREQEASISRVGLRRMIYEHLEQQHGTEFGRRYLLWRHLKTPDKPVVVLIGGATGTGKTTIANELAHRLGIGKVLSTDTIRQIMRMMISPDLLPAIHRSSFEAWKDHPGGERAVVEAFREQSRRVLIGVQALLDRALQENDSLIIDGVHLVPGAMDFKGIEEKSYLIPILVSTLRRKDHLERFPLRQQSAGNRVAKRYRDNFEAIVEIQSHLLDAAEEYEVPIVDNRSFDETVVSVLSAVSSQLLSRLNFNAEKILI